VDHEPAHGEEGNGPEGVKRTVQGLHDAFGDLRFEIDDEIAEGDKVVQRVTMSGRQVAPIAGSEPTGKKFSVRHVYIWRVADGKIVEHWGSRDDLGSLFIGSLIPIALAYAVAHYFTLFVNQGQYGISLASDPFGRGWDLIGTSDFQPSLFNSPNGIWYTQVAVLVIGHVLGLAVAHDKAVALWGSARTAIRTQYAMLALMVLYTCTGLLLLWNG